LLKPLERKKPGSHKKSKRKLTDLKRHVLLSKLELKQKRPQKSRDWSKLASNKRDLK